MSLIYLALATGQAARGPRGGGGPRLHPDAATAASAPCRDPYSPPAHLRAAWCRRFILSNCPVKRWARSCLWSTLRGRRGPPGHHRLQALTGTLGQQNPNAHRKMILCTKFCGLRGSATDIVDRSANHPQGRGGSGGSSCRISRPSLYSCVLGASNSI